MAIPYSEEVAAAVIERMAGGESLRAICQGEDMPHVSTVLDWVAKDKEGFRARYELAMDIRAQSIFEEVLEIADTTREGEEETTMTALLHVGGDGRGSGGLRRLGDVARVLGCRRRPPGHGARGRSCGSPAVALLCSVGRVGSRQGIAKLRSEG